MGNSIWLFFSIPLWFFSTIFYPFSASYLSLVPIIGFLCLLAGAVAAYIRPRKVLLLAPASVLLSQAYAVLAGLLRGEFPHDFATFAIVFLCAQLACLVPLIYFSKGTRAAAIPLFVFCTIYALFTQLVAGMSLSNTWL